MVDKEFIGLISCICTCIKSRYLVINYKSLIFTYNVSHAIDEGTLKWLCKVVFFWTRMIAGKIPTKVYSM